MNFATCFDINYLGRGLALLNSLKKVCSKPFRFFVLALDNHVTEFFNENNQDVTVILLKDLENDFPELLPVKGKRTKVEYYFTLSPYLPIYIFNVFDVPDVTTLDADLYFFDDPNIIYSAYPNASVLITPHNFSKDLNYLTQYGHYNVSFQRFRNDEIGRACLEGWRKDCSEWCFDFYDEVHDRFADQKYLDKWIASYPKVEAIEIKGAGTAPWNIASLYLNVKGNKFFVGDHPLVYYHFHHVRIFNTHFAFTGLKEYKIGRITSPVKKLYQRYLLELRRWSFNRTTNDRKIPRFQKSAGLIDSIKGPAGFLFYTRWSVNYINIFFAKQKAKRIIKRLLWHR